MALFETGERSEPATPRKRQEAREHGQVARSQDLAAAFVLLAACLALHLFGLSGLRRLSLAVAGSFLQLGRGPLDVEGVAQAAGLALVLCAQLLLPFLAVLYSVALSANLVQVGFLVSGHPVAPDLGRVNPAHGLARIFSLRSLLRGAFGLLKVAVVAAVLASTLWNELASPGSPGAAALLTGSLGQAAVHGVELAVTMGLKAGAVILLLAILDYGVQRWLHERDLRMTKGELKEELRRMEGDPRIKDRRRRVLEQLAYQRMMREVPRADVVVTNPTQVAVAIRYDRARMPAPRVVAKGQGLVAQRIRELAMENGVPVVERRELARALYAAVEIGHEIPTELYKAVAELLAYVYRLAGSRAGRDLPASGARPGGRNGRRAAPPVASVGRGEASLGGGPGRPVGAGR